jgi:hypothetical protein
MTTLTALARAHAVAQGRAQQIRTKRHVYLAQQPMVLVPLAMAGEACAPLAAMIGDRSDAGQLLVVPEPRDWKQRGKFASRLAATMVPYLCSFAEQQAAADDSAPAAAAPQLWVPTRSGVEFIRLLGRAATSPGASGLEGASAAVPAMGRWLTFLADRADYVGSSLFLAATDGLARHWATGQSSVEDANLAAVLAWIDPPDDKPAAAAAAEAEDPRIWPPAGPATDPGFDNTVLAKLIDEHRDADPAGKQQALEGLEKAVRGQLEPTWQLMWQTIDLLNHLTPGSYVEKRWDKDRTTYTTFYRDQRPQGHTARAAAIKLNKLEQDQATYDAQCAIDDPLAMGEYRFAGEAFVGEVSHVHTDRRDDTGDSEQFPPRITVHTHDPLSSTLTDSNTILHNAARVSQQAQVISLTAVDDGYEIVLELRQRSSWGRLRLSPAPAKTVPRRDSRVCYGTFPIHPYERQFPGAKDTPWTHGGPPGQSSPEPTQGSLSEEW